MTNNTSLNDNIPGVEEVQWRQRHCGTVNFGHGSLNSSDALDLFKVNSKQLGNLNVVKQDGIFRADIKPEK